MKSLIAIVFLVLPILAFTLIYIEGGLMGVGMYTAYIISAFLVINLPILGIKLLTSKSI